MKQVRRILVAGAQGTGKSTFARLLAKKIPLNNYIIVEPDSLGDAWEKNGFQLMEPTAENLRKPGKKRVIYKASDKDFMNRITENVFNHIIIFDDIKQRATSAKQYDEFEMFFSRARQMGNYIFFTIHSLADIPPNYWTFFTDVFLFKTFDKVDRSMYKIPNWQKFEKAVQYLQSPNPEEKRRYVYINQLK